MNATATLTKRESEVAEHLAWGAAKKEVADTLNISIRTVENTARNIYEKIGIQKATELCVWWFCTHCGVSFELSPVKRTVGIIVLIAFFNCNVVDANDFEKYYRRTRNERSIARRRHFRDEELINTIKFN